MTTMMNISAYKHIIEAEYGIDVLHEEKAPPKVRKRGGTLVCEQSCYMMTSDGELTVFIQEEVTRCGDEYSSEEMTHFSGRFENGLRTITDAQLKATMDAQLEAESFLKYGL